MLIPEKEQEVPTIAATDKLTPPPPITATIVHRETKIGDSLCALPALLSLAGLFQGLITVRGPFSRAVTQLVATSLLAFEPNALTGEIADFRIDIHAAYKQCNLQNQHMAVGLCRAIGLPAPSSPIFLDLVEAPLNLPPGLVISPFSGSSNGWYKVWPMDRWLRLVAIVKAYYPAMPVYLLAGIGDTTEAFSAVGCLPLINHALPQVLHLIRRAHLFVSIDNGISHLAHFGRCTRHILLYPALLAPNLVTNPAAQCFRGRPEDIDVGTIAAAALDVLGTPLPSNSPLPRSEQGAA